MSRIIYLLLICFMFAVCPLPVFANLDNVDESSINLQPDTASKAELLKANQESNARYSEIIKILSKRPQKNFTGISPLWHYNEEKILNVPHHVQQTTYWCGPASSLQIIDYNGRIGSVSGSTEYQKQNTIANQTGTTKSGANTLNLRNNLNSYLSGIHSFNVSTIKKNTDYDKLWNILDYNIFSSGQPVLCLIKTSYLPYYNGKVSYHYVVVDGMNKVIDDSTSQPVKSSSTVRIVDPHYNTSYTGYHIVYFNDLYNALKGYYEAGSQAYNLAY
ncbi:MAG: C39 family peptidase [Desulfurispora sp.]|uniref:C39 family peptidase n=1 Tax=Desulfurispora sp. TaxID=3014275 RepID=UPI004049572C